MPTLRSLVTKLTFQADPKPLVDIGRAIEGIKSRLNLLVGVEAIKGIAALTDKFGNFALDLRNAAGAAGLTTDEFQKLTYAATQAGVSQEAMSSTLKNLNKKLQDARLGSEQAALAFAYAGVQPEQLGSFRNAEDALYALGKSLNSIQDPVRRAASATEILGDQGAKLLASLGQTSGGFKDLARSSDAAANVIGGNNLEALARSEQALLALRSQAGNLAAQLGASLAPAVTVAINGLSKFILTNQGLIRTEFKEWAKRAAYALGAVSGVVAGLAHDLYLLIRQIYTWGKTSGVFAGVAKGMRAIADVAVALLPVMVSLGHAVLDTFSSIAENMGSLYGAVQQALGGIAKIFAQPLDTAAWRVAFDTLSQLVKELARAPFAVIVDAMSSLYAAADKLYGLFFSGQSIKDTWIGKAVDALSGLKGMLSIGGVASGSDPAPGAKIIDVKPMAAMFNAQDITRMQGAPPAQAMGQGAQAAQQTINAPITLTINGDANSKPVLNAVKEGVSEHFEMVMRQTQAGMAPGMVY